MSKTVRLEAYTSLQAGIGKRIAWARELAGLSQTDLASLINVDRSMISHIEAGNRPPSVFNVITLSSRLKVSADYILLGILTEQVDRDLVLRLAALHPELVVGSQSQDR